MYREVAGHQLDQLLYELDGFCVYAARCAEHERPLFAKATASDFPAAADLARLEHELWSLQRFEGQGLPVVQPLYRLDDNQNSYVIYQHFDGAPVDLAPVGARDPATSLDFAVALFAALDRCHEKGLVHLGLSPRAVLWNPNTKAVALSHFVRQLGPSPGGPGEAGPLGVYSAPEQTGRLQAPVDKRADLYSAGAIVYFLLTGQAPFAPAVDRSQLVHHLIARRPTPLATLRPDLTAGLCDLVERLLAKSPLDRFASARDVVTELEALRQGAPGALGARTATPALGLPAMHGRQAELGSLVDAVAEAGAGALRAVFVEGEPGSGKSRLYEDLRALLHRSPELMASGKFDQYRHRRPYSPLLLAFDGLLQEFLSGASASLHHWQQRFSAISGELLSVLAEQIPNLHFMVPGLAPVARLGPSETQNRFHAAIRALLDALCDRDHPLVLYIDDFHWADDATSTLLREVFLRPQRAFLTVMLGFRPHEAALSPAVTALLDAYKEGSEIKTRYLRLQRLPPEAIAGLCADVVAPCRDPQRLAAFVERSCRGNPLFALEVVKRLRRTGELRWTQAGQGGAWDLSASADRGEPEADNVLDLIIDRIYALPVSARRVLLAASCLGHSFVVTDLAIAADVDSAALRAALVVAHDEGLINVGAGSARAWLAGEAGDDDVAFNFFHDRVQQAAHSLCSAEERKRIHLAVGRALMAAALNETTRETLFAAAEHLGTVWEALTPEECARLAEIQLRAGRAAKESIAYQSAANLLSMALKVLERGPGNNPRQMRFACHLQLAESLYLNSSFEEAEATFEATLKLAEGTNEEIEVHRTRLVLYQHMQRYAEAIDLGLKALALLGVKLPSKPSPARLVVALSGLIARTRKVTPETLARQPASADAKELQILELLILLWTPTFWINQKLNALVVLKLVRMTLRLGNTPQAPMAYVCFGILKHVLFKRHREALSFGQLALAALGDKPDPFVASRVRFLALTFFGSLQQDNRTSVRLYEDALAKCLATGEHVFAGHTIDGITTSLPVHGFRMREIEQRLDACATWADQIASDSSRELVDVVRAWTSTLAKGPDEVGERVAVSSLKFDSCIGVHRLLGMAIAYLWNQDQEVLALARQLKSNPVIQSNPLHVTFYALFSILGQCRLRKGAAKVKRALAQIEAFESIWPSNFRSALLLARAEAALMHGRAAAALELYHLAIGEAAARGHDLIHAIASERLAAYYDERKDGKSAREYLAVASFSYIRFGAIAKAENLARRYPAADLMAQPLPGGPAAPSVDLGVEAVMRAAYAIAEETRGDRLARNLLRVITTTAGGERGFLVKSRDDSCTLLAGWESAADSGDVDGDLQDMGELLSEAVVRYVARTRSTLHLRDPARDARFRSDGYLQERRPRSLLCLPLMHRGELSAVLYLENSLCAEVFTAEQHQLASLLGHQAAITMAIADYHKLQMEALQAKINPHFLHNSLSVIAELVIADPRKAEAAVLMLSKLYRYVLNSSIDQIVTLEQELTVTRDYLTLEQYRYGDRLQVDFKVEGPIERVHVPALILQPLVENGVRHGVARKIGSGIVSVHVKVDPAACRMRVSDDGPGWEKPGSGGGSGFGLRSVEERLALLYDDRYELKIEKGKGVTVEVTIPWTAQTAGHAPARELGRGEVGRAPAALGTTDAPLG